MRVLHIITGLAAGGAEQSLFNLIQGGLRCHCQNVVVSLTEAGKYGFLLRELDVPVYSLGMKRGYPSFRALFLLRRILQRHKPDIIQGWMYHGNMLASLSRFFASQNVSVIWNIRQCLYDLSDEKILTQWVIRLTQMHSKSPLSIIYNSSASRRQHEGFGFSSCNGVVIPNGFDLGRYCQTGSVRDIVRDELSISSDECVIGHVGRYHPMKDHASFVKAAEIVLRKNPKNRFLMVGTNVDSQNEQLMELIPADLSKHFLLLGERSDVNRLYCAMDVFCLSSSSEAFPNVLGEAMASSLPCITTNVGDAAYLLGNSGIVVPPKRTEILAKAMVETSLLAKEKKRALGVMARKRIEQQFSLGRVVEAYSALYSGIVRNAQIAERTEL